MSEPSSLHKLIKRIANGGVDIQREDGSFPPGTNGPYQDRATPIRNTGNWLKILSWAYKESGEEKFWHAANAAIEYLRESKHRPHGYTYRCRMASEKDSCNGVVGQANVIEALGRASEYLNRPELLDLPAELYEIHPFNERTAVWNRVEIDGTKLPVDRTFNHQLIFAAASALLANSHSDGQVQTDISAFLDNLPRNMALNNSGAVIHRLRPKRAITDTTAILQDRCLELFLNPILRTKQELIPSKERSMKELGYHSVNLYWLANLKRRVPHHDIWSQIAKDSLLDVTRTKKYRSLAENSTEWFGSIPPGFQIAHAINTFEESPNPREMQYWVSTAVTNHYDVETGLFTKNCNDVETFCGLIYQAIDLPDIAVEL